MSFSKYPKYKPSGVEWLGEVPEHLDVKRLKQACHVFPSNVDKKCHDGETPVVLCNYTDVYYNERITPVIDFMSATASPPQIAKFELRVGDTIITKDSETPDDIAVAAYVPVDLPGVVCGYHLSMVRPLADVDGAFVARLFGSVYAKSCFAVLANGLTRFGLGQYELDNVLLPFPPRDEQTAIAEFLDREAAKIDSLVGEQQRLIELLKEKRQAVISHAVTKGLNPDAPLKPSGIEWLGDVPEHWDCAALTRISSRVVVGIAEAATHAYADEGIPILRSTNVRPGKIISQILFIDPTFAGDRESKRIAAGDLVTVRTGNAGVTAVVPAEFDGCQCFTMLITSLNDNQSAEFYCYWMNSISAQCYFNPTRYGQITIAIPPKEEQFAIVAYLAAETAKLDALTAESERAIELLQERRIALISAAVTGKIDVRRLAETEAA